MKGEGASKVPVNPYYSKCGHVRNADSQAPPRPTQSTPRLTAPLSFQVIQVHADEPCFDKPCSPSCRSSRLFSLPGKHSGEDFGATDPSAFAVSPPRYPSSFSRPSLLFLSPAPSGLRCPLYPIPSLPLLRSITQSALPNSPFLLPQQKGECRGRLGDACTIGGGHSSQLQGLQGVERGLEMYRGAQAGIPPGASPRHPFTSGSRPCWVVSCPHPLCLMCNIFSVITVMPSVYTLNDCST